MRDEITEITEIHTGQVRVAPPRCLRPPVHVRYDLHYSFLKAETTFGEGRSGLYLFPLFRHKKRGGTSEERVSEQRSCNVETGNALASTDNCSDDDSARAANDRMKAAAGPARGSAQDSYFKRTKVCLCCQLGRRRFIFMKEFCRH